MMNGRAMGAQIPLGDGRRIVVPSWVETPERRAERLKIVAGRYFLVSLKGGQLGERMRCRRCRGRHDYLTRYCLELPFSGLRGSLWAYAQTASASADDLPPEYRAKLLGIMAAIGGRSAPDLATSHPRTAAALRRSMVEPSGAPGHLDIDLGAVAVGVIEPLERADAQARLDAINTRAALYRLPRVGVEGLMTR